MLWMRSKFDAGWMLVFVLPLLLAGASAWSQSAPAKKLSVSDDLMISMMVWASARTGLPVPERLPIVQFISKCDLRLAATGSTETCADELGVQAAYFIHERLIFLQDDWDPRSLRDQSFLLHELIHHMQHESDDPIYKERYCHFRNVELPAYEAQYAWIEAAGADPEEVVGMTWFTIFANSICDGFYE